MKRLAMVVAAVALPAAASAATAQQFDLNCSGTQRFIDSVADKTTQYSVHIRVDLDARKWCDEACVVRNDFADIQPGTLIFYKREASASTDGSTRLNTVDRITGDHSVLLTSGRGRASSVLTWKGKCEPAAFSGFPNEVGAKF